MSKHRNEKAHAGWDICSVCGIEFPLVRDDHYVAREVTLTGISTIAGGKEPQLYDAFDCPHCGCQNIMGRRFRTFEVDEEAEDGVQ